MSLPGGQGRTLKQSRRGRQAPAWFALVMLGWLIDFGGGTRAAETPPRELTRANELRLLDPRDAAKALPVRITGVVTYFNREASDLFVQDASGGIYITCRDTNLVVQPGDRVEARGTSVAGSICPVLAKADLQVIGRAPLPVPVRVNAAQLAGGALDSQWVELHGVVQGSAVLPTEWTIDLAMESRQRIKLFLPLPPAPGRERLVDATVRVQGVAAAFFNRAAQIIGARVMVPDLDQLTVERPPPGNDREFPLIPIGEILRFNPEALTGQRLRVRGTLTLQKGRETIFVQDESGAVQVRVREPGRWPLGSTVEVTGFPQQSGYTPRLESATVKPVEGGQPPPPVHISARQALQGSFDARLIGIEGTVLEQTFRGLEQIILLQAGDVVFEARTEDLAPPAEPLRRGSRVALTGVCSVQTDEAKEPVSFRVHFPSLGVVRVLSRPPWWTNTGGLVALGVVTALALGAILWSYSLRRQVNRQTAQIRERLEHEAALEHRFRDLFEHAGELIMITDAQGRLTSVNPATTRLLGYDREALQGRAVSDLAIPEDRERIRALVLEETGGDGRHEAGFLTRSGESVALELTLRVVKGAGRRVAVHIIARDITDRRRLRHSEERFSRIFFASPVALAISVLPEERFTEVNDSFLRAHGFERDEVLGRTPAELGLWAEPATGAALIHAARRHGAVSQRESRLQTKKGSIRQVLLSLEHVDLGRESCLIWIGVDLTDRINLEGRLRQAQKMEAIGQLAAGIAHDFNNIMTVIQGHAWLLLSAPELKIPPDEALRQINRAAERAGLLTRQLLAFSRKQALASQPLDLNELVNNFTRMIRRLIGTNIVLQLNFAPTLPALSGDAGMIEQALMNLAVNARDAMPTGGRITITTAPVEADEAYARLHPGARAGAFVCLSFEDTGCGMDAEARARAFDPFFTTKEPGSGTGLGLATVYGVVKQHDGWIELTSEPGNGTRFDLFLPALPGPPTVTTALSSPPPAFVARGRETILLVEDETTVRELVTDFLRRCGYRVLVATTGAEAMQLADGDLADVSALVTDMVMPEGLSGVDTANRLRARCRNLRVIYTSGFNRELLETRFGLPSGARFVSKPFQPPALAQAVRDCLDADA